jgi:hypothetical protein
MSYSLGHVELGDDVGPGGLSFCSQLVPKPGCTPIPGVVVPMNTHTLATFKALQMGINRILASYKLSGLVNIDGRIGSGTFNAYKKAIAAVRITGVGASGWLGVEALAAASETISQKLNQVADSRGVSHEAGVPPAGAGPKPSVPGPNNTVINPEPTLLDQLGLGGNNTMALVGVVALGGFLFLRGKKKRSR